MAVHLVSERRYSMAPTCTGNILPLSRTSTRVSRSVAASAWAAFRARPGVDGGGDWPVAACAVVGHTQRQRFGLTRRARFVPALDVHRAALYARRNAVVDAVLHQGLQRQRRHFGLQRGRVVSGAGRPAPGAAPARELADRQQAEAAVPPVGHATAYSIQHSRHRPA